MPPTSKSAHTIFHAAQWSQQSGGVQVDAYAPDGDSMTAANPGDWVCYCQVDFGPGQLTLMMAYVAAVAPQKTIQVRLDAPTGELIGTLEVMPTGTADIFTEQYASIASPSGIHDVYLIFPEGAVGLDWFLFATDPDEETPPQRQARMQWWRQARFGAFIHWGAYAVLARGEWAMYFEEWSNEEYEVQAAAQLNPTRFDADAWAYLLKQAGQQYIVITAKHHDGFCMYHTQVRPFTASGLAGHAYNIVDFTPTATDPLLALSQACQRHSLKFCVYYSILDWHHPSQAPIYDGSGLTRIQPAWKARYTSEMKEQLRELVERYDPAVLWFDGDWGGPDWWWTESDGAALYRYLRVLKPDLIINERVKRDCGLGDFRSPEQYIPPTGLPYDWETCMTMNENWGYHASDNQWKSVETLIQDLVDIASKGGNFLLNIGPKADGAFPQESIDRLAAIGNWMALYGQSIYGTTASPFPETPTWGRYTQEPGRLYAHVFNWPSNGRLVLPRLHNLQRIYLVDTPHISLTYALTDETTVIHVPSQAPHPCTSVIALVTENEYFAP